MTKLKVFVDEKTCTECGGKCCQSYPGFTRPSDWGTARQARIAAMAAALQSGQYCVDSWEGDPREGDPDTPVEELLSQVRMLRPSIRGMEGVLYDPTWGGPCTLWTPTGCRLSFEQRPFDCRDLLPTPPKCEPANGGKKGSALAWVGFQDEIASAIGVDNR